VSDRTLVRDAWTELRKLTLARIALGRTGASLPTQAALEFGLAHARARDAVHSQLQHDSLLEQLRSVQLACLQVRSMAEDRNRYLRRPDLGRRLDAESRARLRDRTQNQADVVFVIADGLSARAPLLHAVPTLLATLELLRDWQVAPIVIAEQARVALGDEIGELLHAAQVVMMIGERPGLSSPDSLGIYLTYGPRIGRVDSERNCISNIHRAGLGYDIAAHKLAHLLVHSRARQLSGIELKDESEPGISQVPLPVAGEG